MYLTNTHSVAGIPVYLSVSQREALPFPVFIAEIIRSYLFTTPSWCYDLVQLLPRKEWSINDYSKAASN
jgi:hypothetical protein